MAETIKAQKLEIWQLRKDQEKQRIRLSIKGIDTEKVVWRQAPDSTWSYYTPLCALGQFRLTLTEGADGFIFQVYTTRLINTHYPMGAKTLGEAKITALQWFVNWLESDQDWRLTQRGTT
jgi:hypothetical protein